MLRSTFARFGLPRVLISDNATNFCSAEFQQFLSNNGIKHITSPPYHPQSNGAAENTVQIVKNVIKKALYAHKDIDLALQRFLFDHRTTAHCTTGESPAKLMFGRNVRTRFDLIMPDKSQKQEDERVRNNVRNSQLKQIKYFKGSRSTRFFEGERVLVRNYGKSPPWISGNVKQVLGSTVYLVYIPTLCVTWKRHVNQLRKTLQYIPGDRSLENVDVMVPQVDVPIVNKHSMELRRRSQLFPPDRY